MPRARRRGAAISLIIASSAVVAVGQNSVDQSSCPCIDNILTHPGLEAINSYVQNNELVYTPPGSSQSYTFPTTYGNGGCDDHDYPLAPYCSGSSVPSWCQVKWCYVDANQCSGVAKIRTRFFTAVDNLYFSYGTCVGATESSNSYESWSDDVVAKTKKMIGLVEDYARSARFAVEETYADLTTSASCSLTAQDMCSCAGCSYMDDWKSEVLFTEVGTLEGPAGTQDEKTAAACLAEGIATTYQRTAAIEADPDFARVGYQYFADQATGTFTQWPKQKDMCVQDYDPRFRPWYAAAATGPKDVIIVVDVSGSMHEADRHALAKAAVKAILDTVTWKDFATIILFNNAIASIYSETLVPVTETLRAAMTGWCDEQSWKSGGTSFTVPMQKAFEVVEKSIKSGSTSMCQKAVMFLTDGQASFGENDFRDVKEKSEQYDVVIFSYALGSGAETVTTKRLACENRGVFYNVPDGADLSHIMSAYYEYFAYGQEMCSGSWIKYTAYGGGHTLYAGCMAMYDRTVPMPELLGVSCLDLNLFADVSAMKVESGWNYFKCVASDMTKMCRQVLLSECHRQKIRLSYSQDSVCTESYNDYQDVASTTVCPCADQSCQDTNQDWTDEKGYFCDTWVGDNCTNPDPSFGYTSAGMAEVRANCKRSCNLCDWSQGSCTATSSQECPVVNIPTECRACLGKVSGVDIDGNGMECPPDAPRDLMSTTTTPCPSANGVCMGSASGAVRRSPPIRAPSAVAAAAAAAAAFFATILGSAAAATV